MRIRTIEIDLQITDTQITDTDTDYRLLTKFRKNYYFVIHYLQILIYEGILFYKALLL